MGPLPRTMIECLLWSCAIVFYISLAQEGESKKLSFCYVGRWYHDNGEIQELKNPHSYCSAKDFFINKYGAVEFEASGFYPGEQESPKSENPLGCEMLHFNGSIYCPEDEEEFSRHNYYLFANCYCNQSPICATQPETFESALNAHGSDLQYCARKAGEILLEHLRAGKMKNNASEVLEEFMATSSTSIPATKATSTGPSTRAETTTTKEAITTKATSTSQTDTSTTATSTSQTETSTVATSSSPTETSTTATSTEGSTIFATTSDYEYSDTYTTSAYDDQGFITDKESYSTSKTEAAEKQQMYSLPGQYGLAILVACAISLIVIIAIIPVILRNGRRNEHVEGAVGKRGTSKVKGSQERSNEGSRESKSKEGGSKEKMTLSRE